MINKINAAMAIRTYDFDNIEIFKLIEGMDEPSSTSNSEKDNFYKLFHWNIRLRTEQI